MDGAEVYTPGNMDKTLTQEVRLMLQPQNFESVQLDKPKAITFLSKCTQEQKEYIAFFSLIV